MVGRCRKVPQKRLRDYLIQYCHISERTAMRETGPSPISTTQIAMKIIWYHEGEETTPSTTYREVITVITQPAQIDISPAATVTRGAVCPSPSGGSATSTAAHARPP